MTQPATDRLLIVNADDLGYSPAVNRGIAQAHDIGIVTSASVMVRWPAAGEVGALARAHPRLSLGLHVDLGEWTVRDGQWIPLYEVICDADMKQPKLVAAEVERQLDAFQRLVRRPPTHLDSHQHVHRQEPLRTVLQTLARRLNIPLRHFDPRVRYCGDFYGQANIGQPYPQGISTENLLRAIRSLPPGVTELTCHPAAGVDHHSLYAAERLIELGVLSASTVRDVLHHARVKLISFADLRA